MCIATVQLGIRISLLECQVARLKTDYGLAIDAMSVAQRSSAGQHKRHELENVLDTEFIKDFVSVGRKTDCPAGHRSGHGCIYCRWGDRGYTLRNRADQDSKI